MLVLTIEDTVACITQNQYNSKSLTIKLYNSLVLCKRPMYLFTDCAETYGVYIKTQAGFRSNMGTTDNN